MSDGQSSVNLEKAWRTWRVWRAWRAWWKERSWPSGSPFQVARPVKTAELQYMICRMALLYGEGKPALGSLDAGECWDAETFPSL